jgi:hypothetical protein
MYILNRKDHEPKMGNTLIAPSVLLNPVVNKSTQQKDSVVTDGERFEPKEHEQERVYSSSQKSYRSTQG